MNVRPINLSDDENFLRKTQTAGRTQGLRKHLWRVWTNNILYQASSLDRSEEQSEYETSV